MEKQVPGQLGRHNEACVGIKQRSGAEGSVCKSSISRLLCDSLATRLSTRLLFVCFYFLT